MSTLEFVVKISINDFMACSYSIFQSFHGFKLCPLLLIYRGCSCGGLYPVLLPDTIHIVEVEKNTKTFL